MQYIARVFQANLENSSLNITGTPFSYSYVPASLPLEDLCDKSPRAVFHPSSIRRILKRPEIAAYFGPKVSSHICGVDVYSIGEEIGRGRVIVVSPTEQITSVDEINKQKMNHPFVGPISMDIGLAPYGKVVAYAQHILPKRAANPVRFPVTKDDFVYTTEGVRKACPTVPTATGKHRVLALG